MARKSDRYLDQERGWDLENGIADAAQVALCVSSLTLRAWSTAARRRLVLGEQLEILRSSSVNRRHRQIGIDKAVRVIRDAPKNPRDAP